MVERIDPDELVTWAIASMPSFTAESMYALARAASETEHPRANRDLWPEACGIEALGATITAIEAKTLVTLAAMWERAWYGHDFGGLLDESLRGKKWAAELRSVVIDHFRVPIDVLSNKYLNALTVVAERQRRLPTVQCLRDFKSRFEDTLMAFTPESDSRRISVKNDSAYSQFIRQRSALFDQLIEMHRPAKPKRQKKK